MAPVSPLAMLVGRSFAELSNAFQCQQQLWSSAAAVTVTTAFASRSTNHQSSCHNVNEGPGKARAATHGASVCQRPSWPVPGLPGHCYGKATRQAPADLEGQQISVPLSC